MIDTAALVAEAKAWLGWRGWTWRRTSPARPPITGTEGTWTPGEGHAKAGKPKRRVVAIDYGCKRNILRCLVSAGCEVIVVPANATAAEVLSHDPDGIFLSNGPGDPAATGVYAVPVIRELVDSGKPIFGICLGHQMLSIALGCVPRR